VANNRLKSQSTNTLTDFFERFIRRIGSDDGTAVKHVVLTHPCTTIQRPCPTVGRFFSAPFVATGCGAFRERTIVRLDCDDDGKDFSRTCSPIRRRHSTIADPGTSRRYFAMAYVPFKAGAPAGVQPRAYRRKQEVDAHGVHQPLSRGDRLLS